jgi:hypothetical protein
MKSLYAVLILVVLFAAMSVVSWHTWANPVIDSGREMNTPLRLLHGELLYSQVYYLYGPVAPYFNALLYKIFGIHLNVLYAAGLAASLLLVVTVFCLARWFMNTSEAMLAGGAVILFSIFKQKGNLIFPYTFSALYGTLLGTLALIAQVDFIRSRRIRSLYAAGALSGLALCCKFEFGIAATASLIAMILSAPREQRARAARISLATLALFPLVIYGLFFMQIPAAAIIKDTFILPGYIPAELIYFNKSKLGLNDPGKTVREMINALALLVGCGGAALLAGVRMSGKSIAFSRAEPRLRRIWLATLACGGLMLIHLLLFGTSWDLNPFRALPILFLGMIWFYLKAPNDKDETNISRRSLLIISIYSLAVMARAIVRVNAGGGLLVIPLLLLVFISAVRLPAFSISPEAGNRTRHVVTLLLTVCLVAALGVLSFRENIFNFLLHTPRGDLRLSRALGEPMSHTLNFISNNSSPGDYILGLPEGSSLNFLADRRAPLRYEILTPGFLTESAEQESIRSLREKNVRYIFLFNRPTAEFGAKVFGRDYYRTLMGWIEANYKETDVPGELASPEDKIGGAHFFIKCYARR